MDPKLETLKIVAHRNEQRFGWGLSYLSRKLRPGNSSGNSCPGNSGNSIVPETPSRKLPNSFIRGGGDHVFETDAQGKVIRDISL
jgi:hypothetical protein